MKESQDAAKAISSSPLKITVPESSTEPTSVVKMDGLKAEFQKQDSSKEQNSEFLVEISETLTYRHEQSAKNSPLTRPWPEFVVKSPTFASKTLERSLPDSMAAIGLRHWDVDLGQQEVADNKRFEREQMRNWLPSKIKDPAAKSKASNSQEGFTSSAAPLESSTENTAETSAEEKMVEASLEKAAEEKMETSIEKPADDTSVNSTECSK
ncbi:hypothetical protein NW768_005211 [Fusarium equiseti]|uniref:Uncharacterized protein n=1 Tax=Fusarium equiseti TaxID=61235 RepID=A0ABQ8REM4_FUSEQ|nr:hypothetical protein NW768_005211 [Fusarium equiseti]